jgi:hypothetical protein
MQRILGLFSLGVVLAAVAALRDAPPDACPPLPPLPADDVTTASIGHLPAAPGAEASFVREEVVAPGSRELPDTATTLTFVLSDAPPAALHGVAFVRRKDGGTAEVAFAGGRFTVADRRSLGGVSLRVPGFAIAWPALDARQPTIDVPMQRAGAIHVHLTDASGTPLAHRVVMACLQQAAIGAPPAVTYTGNPRGVTDANGTVRIDHALAGTYRVFVARVAEWQPVVAEGVVVATDAVTLCELVAATPPPSRFGGFRFPLASAPGFTASGNDVISHLFATVDGREFMLAVLGDQVRGIAHGAQGDMLTGSIVAIRRDGDGPPLGPPVSAPITITVGAVFDWQPAWLR